MQSSIPLFIISILSAAHLVSSTVQAQESTSDQIETARLAAHKYRQIYWDCLASYSSRAQEVQLPPGDFKELLKGSCLVERQNFKVPFIDFMAMSYPTMESLQSLLRF